MCMAKTDRSRSYPVLYQPSNSVTVKPVVPVNHVLEYVYPA